MKKQKESGKTKLRRKGSIKTRIITLTAFIIVLVVGAMATAGLLNAQSLIKVSETRANDLVEKGVNDEIAARLTTARVSILSVVNNPDIAKALADQDRATLAKLIQPVFDTIKSQGVSQVQFHLAPAVSFYRAHMPAKFGDDLSAFRHTVVTANKEQRIVEGLEEGVDGYGFRVVVPIKYEGKPVGSAEYGMDFGTDFLKALQQRTAGDYFIYVLDPATSMVKKVKETNGLLAGTSDKDSYPVPEATVKSFSSGQQRFLVSADGQSSILLIPFKDYQGQVKGYIKAVIPRTQILSQWYSLVRWMSIVALLVLLVGLIASYIEATSLARPLAQLAGHADILATGNLNVDVNTNYHGELGTLGRAMKKMLENTRTACSSIHGAVSDLETAVHDISGASAQTSQVAEQVAETVNQISSGAQSTAQTTNDISLAAGGMTEKIETLVSHVDSITANTVETASRTEHGEKIMQELALKMKTTATKAEDIQEAIHTLNEQTGKIRGITDVIKGIADQTNLLALNAAIEAARAGEAGRGFSVVAEEVKKLAEESSNRAAEIAGLISQVTENVELSARTTEEAVNLIDEQVRIGDKALGEFTEIADSAKQVASLLREVEIHTKEMLGVGQKIAFDINNLAATSEQDAAAAEEIAAATQELSAAAGTINSNAQELSELMQELKTQSSRFQL